MKRVLIVEDDQLIANVYRNKFAVEGFAVEVANSGEEGLDLIQNFQPDVVILDLLLPKMSGLELMKQIRALPQFGKLPLVVFSNTYLSNLIQEAWKAGATKCLSKANSSPKQVIEAVISTLNPGAEPTPKATPFEPRAKLAPAPSTRQTSFIHASETITPETFPATINQLRLSIQALGKAASETDRSTHTQDLYRRIRRLTSTAHLAGLADFAQLTEAMEALLVELHQKPTATNASTLRTLAAAVDCLPFLFASKGAGQAKAGLAQLLIVDDDPISRRAIAQALTQAKLKYTEADKPETALRLLSNQSFDLIFLDVDMPGMTGHELCARLRTQPLHQNTPVVFVTGFNDFQNRASSIVSGGNDFIGKPFLFVELAVKSLVYVLRAKYKNAIKPSAASGTPQSSPSRVAA
jgi:CheY-like chemotaxis protein